MKRSMERTHEEVAVLIGLKIQIRKLNKIQIRKLNSHGHPQSYAINGKNA